MMDIPSRQGVSNTLLTILLKQGTRIKASSMNLNNKNCNMIWKSALLNHQLVRVSSQNERKMKWYRFLFMKDSLKKGNRKMQ